MEKHVNLISLLWIIYGTIGLCFGFLIGAVLFGLSFIPHSWSIAPGLLRLIAWGVACFFAVLSLPQIIGGIGLLKRQEWGRILVIVVSLLHVLSFPFGTALGVYSLVILLKDQTVKLFARP